jgi:hypothetical protein
MARKINFTKAAIDDLACTFDKADVLVYDTEEKGLAIRVTKAGGKTFFVIRKVKGKDHRIKLEQYDKRLTKIPAVREKARQIYTNLETILEEKHSKSKQDQVTLRRAFDDMLAVKSKITDCTVTDYKKSFKHLEELSGTALALILNDDVVRIHREVTTPRILKNGLLGEPRNRTANKVISLLGCIFGFAIVYYRSENKRLFKYNPVDIMNTMSLWHVNNRSKVRINPVELPGFITECLSIADAQPLRDVETSFKSTSAAVLFMLFSGVRPGEASKIKKEYVHHATRSIIFPKRTRLNEQDTLKNGKEFHLVLSDSAYCQILYAMKHSKSDYVFSGVSKERLGESSTRDFLERIKSKTGKHMQRKIMRASFISLAESTGVGAFHIKVLCNHDGQGQQVDVTDGYKTAYLNEIRDATVKIEDAIYKFSGADRCLVCRGLLETLAPLDSKLLEQVSVSM